MNETKGANPARRFALALREALHDAGHENHSEHDDSHQRVSLVHYWDTDCLIVPAFGFLASSNRPSEGDRLVHALFSGGFLGPVHVAPAHQVELTTVLRSWMRQEKTVGADYPRQVRQFARRNGLDSVLDDLVSSVRKIESGHDSIGLKEAIGRLNRLDRVTFAHVESLSGTWPTRLATLLGGTSPLVRTGSGGLSFGDYGEGGPSAGEIAAHPLFMQFLTSLNERRFGRRLEQTSIDAAALTWIAMVVERARETRRGVFPRFYTSSPTIKNMYNEEKFAYDAFAVNYETSYGKTFAGTIWRDSYSYLLRAVLPSLMPPDSRVGTLDAGPTFAELTELSKQLDSALESGDDELRRQVELIKLSDGSRLVELIDSLESSGMALVWLRYPIDSQLVRIVSGLRSVVKLSDFDESIRVAGSLLAESASELNRSASALATQVLLTAHVIGSWRKSKKLNRSAGPPGLSVLRDLGAIRWGIRSAGEDDWLNAPIELGPPAPQILGFNEFEELRGSARRAERAMSVLIGFELFRDADRLSRLLYGDSAYPTESLWLMHQAAIVQASGRRQGFNLSTYVSQLTERYSSLEAAQQHRLCLGFGYCAFHAWQCSIPETLVDRWPSDRDGWVRWSLEICQDSLAEWKAADRLFAINHLVYASAVAGIRLPNSDSYFEELSSFERNGVGGDFRFEDTLGYVAYLEALREIRHDTFLNKSAMERWESAHGPSLARGIRHLRAAADYSPNDRLVARHLRKAIDLQRAARLMLDSL